MTKINWKNIFKSKRNLVLIAVLLIVAAGGYFTFYKKKNGEVQYNESVAEIGDIEIKILATGTVQPENRLEIKPPVAGRVEKVLIKEGQEVKQGQLLAWMSSTERAALLDSARAKGVKELKKWEDIYPPTPIMAPLDGTIVVKGVEQGQTVTNNDVLLVMSDRLTVKAQVDETDIASISNNQEADIVLDAYQNEKIPAKVDKIAFEATTVNSVTTYIVDVLPTEVPSFMRSGMTANVVFYIDTKKDILLIPSEALKVKKGHSLVLVREGKQEVEREVETGITNGKRTEIISGLKEGDIVLSPKLKLDDKKGGSSAFGGPTNRPRR